MSLQHFQPGKPVAVPIVMSDEAGEVLTPIEPPKYRVLDQADAEVLAWTNAPAAVDGRVVIQLTAAQTALQPPLKRGILTVELEVTTIMGTVMLSESILLRGSQSLTIPLESFQTYGQACLLAEQEVKIDGWAGANKDGRERALARAAGNIARLSFRNRLGTDMSSMDFTSSPFEQDRVITQMSPSEFAALNPLFKEALCRAQVLEADGLLVTGDEISEARDNGLISMTVGESSQFFSSRKKLDLGVNRRAYEVLAPWLNRGIRIGRG